jgi:hypothetical protein
MTDTDDGVPNSGKVPKGLNNNIKKTIMLSSLIFKTFDSQRVHCSIHSVAKTCPEAPTHANNMGHLDKMTIFCELIEKN